MPYIRFGSVNCDIRTKVGGVRWMASRRVGYPEVVCWPSVFIMSVSPFTVYILTSLPSSLMSTTLAHFCSLLMMTIAFITIKSSFVPLIEGLCARIYFRFEMSVVCSHLFLFSFVKEKTC